jgi:TfoX/Sxy family transcriptional regulator of competence genes
MKKIAILLSFILIFITVFGQTEIINEPVNLTQFRGQTGKTLLVKITGTNQGNVWGGVNGIYTDDSNIGKAAVHAGLLKVGEQKVLKVTIVPGQSSYHGNTQNGITTNNYEQWHGSFKFEDVKQVTSDEDIYSEPINLSQFRGQNGKTIFVKITGTIQGNVWGGANGIYTDDSNIGKAAVHAGLLKVGEQKVLEVTIVPGQSSYHGNTQNGITTNNYDQWHGSFKFEGGKQVTPVENIINEPIDMKKFRGQNGSTYKVKVTGTNEGNVWGGANGIYTDDSRVGKAAVHAGLLKVGEQKVLNVTIVPGQSSYHGNTQNGITTNNYDQWHGSYNFEP